MHIIVSVKEKRWLLLSGVKPVGEHIRVCAFQFDQLNVFKTNGLEELGDGVSALSDRFRGKAGRRDAGNARERFEVVQSLRKGAEGGRNDMGRSRHDPSLASTRLR